LSFTLDGTPDSGSATVTVSGEVLGVLTITTDANGDATWSFDPTNVDNSVSDPSFTFIATVTDDDGDEATDSHTVTVTDGQGPGAEGTLALIVDEKDLADGTVAGGPAGGDPDTQDVEQGGLVFTAGSDAITSIKFDLAASQPTTGTGLDGSIVWSLSGDGLTLTGSIGGTDVITLVLSGELTATAGGGTAAPTVTATLLDEFPHEDVPDFDTLTISGITVVASEADPTDFVTATISLQVLDDEPRCSMMSRITSARRLRLSSIPAMLSAVQPWISSEMSVLTSRGLLCLPMVRMAILCWMATVIRSRLVASH
jgi:hypothetical protein